VAPPASQLHVALAIGQLSYGGAETQLCELVEGLQGQARVTVYCLSGRSLPLGARVEAAGARLVVFPAGGGFDVRRVLALRRQLAADRPSLVHAFLYIADAYVWAATLGLRNLPFVASARNCKLDKNPVRRFLFARAITGADALICNSAEMAAFAAKHYGASPGRTRVVYNGVDADRFVVSERQQQGPLRIGTVGRIESQKNLDLFLSAAHKVLQVQANAIFEVVGDGSLREHFTQKAKAAGLADRVRFLGTTAEIPEFLASLDQFWLTSNWEGTPNVVLEAMATGVPVVATRVGGTSELIDDGRTGRLVGAGDAESFASAALELAADREAAYRLGMAARSEVEQRFSVPAMIRATRAVYEEVLGSAGSDRPTPASLR
jgi:glycosyltransferase involved in cell wall biosynthesis